MEEGGEGHCGTPFSVPPSQPTLVTPTTHTPHPSHLPSSPMGAASCEDEDLEFKLIFGEEDKEPVRMGVSLEGEGWAILGGLLLKGHGKGQRGGFFFFFFLFFFFHQSRSMESFVLLRMKGGRLHLFRWGLCLHPSIPGDIPGHP